MQRLPEEATLKNRLNHGKVDRRTIQKLAERIALLFDGEHVIVDANFREQSKRRAFLEVAARWSVPVLLFVCRAAPETARARLAARQGDASDADWTVYQHLASLWQEPADEERLLLRDIRNDGDQAEALETALSVLRKEALL